jgi:hypothetical protein
MALTGRAAVAMWWHIAAEWRDEFLDWHTHEHLPERLGIDGFLRGTRWASEDDATGFFVMYELASQEVLAGPAYLARLNAPTPWSVKLMPHHAGMVRTLCDVTASVGAGNGRFMLTLRLAPAAGREAALRRHLQGLLAPLAQRRGVAGAHLLERSALGPVAQTEEQRIRGGDAAADWIVLVCGYDAAVLRGLLAAELAAPALAEAGAAAPPVTGLFGMSGGLSAGEV